jgi:tRNA pseudouridine55 synthase
MQEYRATGLLGSATDSYDSEGKKVKIAPHSHVTPEKVEAVLAKFRGDIKQLPPM